MATAKTSAKTTAKSKTKPLESVVNKSPAVIMKERKLVAKSTPKAGPKNARAKTEAVNKPKTRALRSEAAKVNTTNKSVKPPRTKLERRGKKYRNLVKDLDLQKVYELKEAVELLPKMSFTKFTSSVELHANLGVNPKQSDQNVRGTVSLPHSLGRTQTIAVLAESDKEQRAAKTAGADIVGFENLLSDIEKGKLDFDLLVTIPAHMSLLAKHAKILGPQGLMPSPKSGTVSNNLEATVKELKAGRIEFRVDSAGIIHQVVGKLDLKADQLLDNIKILIKAIQDAKPASVKGTYLKRLWLTTTMGPSLKINAATASAD